MHSGGPPIRVALDAHVVGRRKTGNETYIVGLGGALAARPDVETLAYVDRGASWPDGNGAAPALRELRMRRPYLRIPWSCPSARAVTGQSCSTCNTSRRPSPACRS